MKYGVRKPNIKKSIKARTTGKVKRQVKKSVNPLYGKKGMGIIKNPKKAAYNALYSRTTVGVSDVAKGLTSTNSNFASPVIHKKQYSDNTYNICGLILIVLGILLLILGIILLLVSPIGGIAAILFGVLSFLIGRKYRKTVKEHRSSCE